MSDIRKYTGAEIFLLKPASPDDRRWILDSAHLKEIEALQEKLTDQIKKNHLISANLIRERERVEALQARIDELMLEYCPDEMTEEQLENWAKHQKPVEDKQDE